MLEEAKARVPVGEVKKPLRADVERRVYVPEPLNMYASSSRLVIGVLSLFFIPIFNLFQNKVVRGYMLD